MIRAARIGAFMALMLGVLAPAGAQAAPGSLLSGYQSPGGGEQVILGSSGSGNGASGSGGSSLVLGSSSSTPAGSSAPTKQTAGAAAPTSDRALPPRRAAAPPRDGSRRAARGTATRPPRPAPAPAPVPSANELRGHRSAGFPLGGRDLLLILAGTLLAAGLALSTRHLAGRGAERLA